MVKIEGSIYNLEFNMRVGQLLAFVMTLCPSRTETAEDAKARLAEVRRQMEAALVRRVQVSAIERDNMEWYESRIAQLEGDEEMNLEPDLRQRYADHFRRRICASTARAEATLDGFWRLSLEEGKLSQKLNSPFGFR